MELKSLLPAGADDIARALLRVALGVLILLHGIAKIQNGLGFVCGVLDKAGLPPAMAYLVYVGEVLAPVLLIVGLYARAAALIVLVNMLFAVGLVDIGRLFALTPSGGWALELQAMFIVAAIAVALLGAGRYSLGGSQGRWN